MKITFLFGNGFDIQCGLRTSYQDFYKYILNERYQSICMSLAIMKLRT